MLIRKAKLKSKNKLAKMATRHCGTGLVWITKIRENIITNRANVFGFLSSFPLLPQATMAVIGSYLSSLYS